MTDQLRNAIRTMRAKTQPTKSALVRTLIPEIEEALIAGYRLKTIWQWVRDNGLDVTYPQFCTYLFRERKKSSRTAAPRGKKAEAEVPGAPADGFDPLANLRRRQASRPGFHYRGTEDLDILVHGRKKDDGQQGK